MFLIFGIKRMVRRLGTVFAMCGHCHSPAAQVIVRRSTWLSLFFIPVIPLGSKYISTCTLCGSSTRIEKDQALHMVEVSRQSSAPAPVPAPPLELPPPPQTPAPPPA
jgi:zinc-ribbon family